MVSKIIIGFSGIFIGYFLNEHRWKIIVDDFEKRRNQALRDIDKF